MYNIYIILLYKRNGVDIRLAHLLQHWANEYVDWSKLL